MWFKAKCSRGGTCLLLIWCEVWVVFELEVAEGPGHRNITVHTTAEHVAPRRENALTFIVNMRLVVP